LLSVHVRLLLRFVATGSCHESGARIIGPLAQCLAPHVMGTTAVDAGETHRFWPEQQFTSF